MDIGENVGNWNGKPYENKIAISISKELVKPLSNVKKQSLIPLVKK